MTTEEKLMQACGTYSLPVLIHLYTKDKTVDLYYVNDVKKVSYGGHTYEPGAFEYTPNPCSNGFDGGGKLSIAARENKIIPMLDTYREVFLEAVGGLDEGGNVEAFEFHSHHYGSVSVADGKAEFTFEKDDRLSMQFPALIWNRQNNRGNS